MARDEDIFRKLKKETPIVKQKNLQPLSQRDFTPPKTTLNIPVEYSDKRRKKITRDEPVIFSGAKDEVPTKPPVKREPLEKAVPEKKKPEKELDIYTERPAVSKPAVARREVSAQNAAPEKSYAPKPERSYTQNAAPERSYAPKPERSYAPNAKLERTQETKPQVRQDLHDAAYVEDIAKDNGFELRHELKYYINYHDYVILRSNFKSLMSPDPYADEDNSYHVRSLYFDDINDSALREKIAGSDNRRKYRIRIYNFQDNTIKFEKKYKIGQYIGKKSINLERYEYESIVAGDYGVLLDRGEEFAKELYLEMRSGILRPRVIVDYVREAYVSPFENCRITFDKDLRASIMLKDIFDSNAPVMPMYEPGLMVLEVKFDKFLPVTVKRVLNVINAADRCAISKYVISRRFD